MAPNSEGGFERREAHARFSLRKRGDADSLFLEKFSLIRLWKFPVLLRREFRCKLLNPRVDQNRRESPDSTKFPVNFPVSREFGAETSSSGPRTNQSMRCRRRDCEETSSVLGMAGARLKTPPRKQGDYLLAQRIHPVRTAGSRGRAERLFLGKA
jgi:hypothetical protein